MGWICRIKGSGLGRDAKRLSWFLSRTGQVGDAGRMPGRGVHLVAGLTDTELYVRGRIGAVLSTGFSVS